MKKYIITSSGEEYVPQFGDKIRFTDFNGEGHEYFLVDHHIAMTHRKDTIVDPRPCELTGLSFEEVMLMAEQDASMRAYTPEGLDAMCEEIHKLYARGKSK